MQREKNIIVSRNSYTFFVQNPGGLGWHREDKSIGITTKIIEDYSGGVRLINRQGEMLKDVMSGGEADYFKDAIYSPDEQKIAALYRFSDGNQCPVLLNAAGGGLAKLNNCELDDHPRFWSVDGKWIIVWSDRELKFYAYEVNGSQRVPLTQLGIVQMYDQRYWPWKIVDAPICKGGNFWDCE